MTHTGERAIPRIDVDSASRDKLIAHIDALENILIDLVPTSAAVDQCRAVFNVSPSRAQIILALATGRVMSRETLQRLCYGDGDRASNIVDVHLCTVRKVFSAHGIKVLNSWGGKWRVDGPDLQKLRSLLSERAAA